MQSILVQLLMNKELLLIYEIASFAIGIILLYVTEKTQIYYDICIFLVVAFDCFMIGSFLGEQLFYNEVSFFAGGLIGMFLLIYIHFKSKSVIRDIFSMLTITKILIIIKNFTTPHELPEQELEVFKISFIGALLAIIVIVIIREVIKRRGMYDFKTNDSYHKILCVLCGACIVTGRVYEFLYDRVTQQLKFLEEKNELINFYKVVCALDWNENSSGLFFIMLFAVLVSVSGVIYIIRK